MLFADLVADLARQKHKYHVVTDFAFIDLNQNGAQIV